VAASEPSTATATSTVPLLPFPDDWTDALCIVAHPDDLEYGAAAAVARWTAEGRRVSYLLVTRGEAGIDGMSPAEAGPRREAEERASAAVVGVDTVEFLDGHVDGVIEYGLPLRRDLAAAIRRMRPDVVVSANHTDTWGGRSFNMADHRHVGLATLDAARDAGNRWIFSDAGEPWSGVRWVAEGGSPRPTHFVDVGDTIGVGVASLREHAAYLDGLGTDFDPDAFLRGNARAAGEVAGCDYAATFQLYEL
jgi:LmbE family N-acetylglucosaminyl deacetylase